MNAAPKWYLPTAIVALLWNLLGCAAYLSDVRLTPEDIAKMSAAQQALYNARPAWAVAAMAIAVWGGAAGCVALIWRKRWATPVLIASLLGLVAQDVGMFVLSGVAVEMPAIAIQSMVFLIAIGLVVLARTATSRGWIN